MTWEDIEPELDRSLIYYVWTVRKYQSHDVFGLLTQTRLLNLRFTDEGWMYSLIHGYQGRAENSESEDTSLKPTIRFGVYPLYFIRESPRGRKGWIRPGYKIYQDETSEPADTSWKPQVIPEEEDRTGQLEVYGQLLTALGKGDYTVQQGTESLKVPEFYLSRPMAKATTNLYLRNTKEAGDAIRNHPDYDPSKTLKQNEKDLIMTFGKDAGLKRVAFPWKYFCGQGVPVTDFTITNQWFARPAENMMYEDTGVKVNLGKQYLK